MFRRLNAGLASASVLAGMANYREIVRRFPAARHYVRHRRWAKRGDVTAYAPNCEGGAFSTDRFGFRRGELNGAPYDLSAAFSGAPFGLVLGSSHVFGFGLDGNARSIPSRLSSLLGFACLNVSFPEADLRTLHAAATRITAHAPRPPAFICCFVGGTFTRYCYTRRCDALFGAPDFRSYHGAQPLAGSAAEAAAFSDLVDYGRFWLDQLNAFAEAQGCPLLIPAEFTAFEKRTLNGTETACELTVPIDAVQRGRFDTHRLRFRPFKAALTEWMDGRVLLADMDPDALSFIDEFHYTQGAAELMAGSLAARLALPVR